MIRLRSKNCNSTARVPIVCFLLSWALLGIDPQHYHIKGSLHSHCHLAVTPPQPGPIHQIKENLPQRSRRLQMTTLVNTLLVHEEVTLVIEDKPEHNKVGPFEANVETEGMTANAQLSLAPQNRKNNNNNNEVQQVGGRLSLFRQAWRDGRWAHSITTFGLGW